MSFNHPHVCRLLGHFSSSVTGYLAFELCNGGDLADLFGGDGGVGDRDVSRCMVQLLDAVSYMHSSGVTHRDVKPQNVLLSSKDRDSCLQLKLADFGLCSSCPPGGSLQGFGTIPYMSPEQLVGFCNESCDVWACGCILFEFLFPGQLLLRGHGRTREQALKFLRSPAFEEEVMWVLGTQCMFAGVISEELLWGLLCREWSTRLSAAGALRIMGEVLMCSDDDAAPKVNLDNGALSSRPPPPFLPEPWYAHWSVEHSSWFFARSDAQAFSTWEVPPPFLPVPWSVHWCPVRRAFHYEQPGLSTWEMPLELTFDLV